ncbi:MAG TPA: recombinase family protein [Acidimicrobiales bacterium]|nr:recombinase family protein [Acidimicrobiales bacterium]
MTTRFAFYGRVSTEDQQDPTSSKQWQVSRAQGLIDPHGGVIRAEYFDIGQSRSLPWKRRPEATALLEALKNPARGFDAIVIGEPARAFSGNQFALTFPVFTHYGVELWVPEVGGRVDPGSDAHDLVMNLYGGMSKGERNRIKVRVRSAMSAQAQHEGRFLGGRPPYGYRLADAGSHPNPGKAAMGARLHRLEVDPTAAPIVARIFADYLGGSGLYAVAEGLTRDGIPSPSAHDPERNRHRDGRAWSKSAVRAILTNPRYTGRQVWNRAPRVEELLDVEDVGAGHQTKQVWNDPSAWVWSAKPAHEALVSSEDFAAVQTQLSAGAHRPVARKGHRTNRTYVLAGRVRCTLCDRRMQGHWNHDSAHYRCRYAAEYALANKVDHPKTVYLREDAVVPKLDAWLAELFDPANLDATCEALAMAGDVDEAAEARMEAARRKVADCDSRLAKYRAALDAGADATIVAGWMAEVQGERLRAEIDLGEAVPGEQMTKEQVRTLVLALHDIASVLATADPKLKAEVYAELGVSVSYDHVQRIVRAEARPTNRCANGRVGEGT